MTSPKRPELSTEDDLTQPVDIDLNAALAPLIAQRTQSPIIRSSMAADITAMIDDSFPKGGDSLTDLVAQITNATERYPRRNTHPGFFGWIAPSGLPTDPTSLLTSKGVMTIALILLESNKVKSIFSMNATGSIVSLGVIVKFGLSPSKVMTYLYISKSLLRSIVGIRKQPHQECKT